MRTTIVMLTAAASMVTLLPAADEPSREGRSADALAIVERADTAIKQVGSVRIVAEIEPSGIATGFADPTEGSSLLVGWNGSTAEKFYSEITIDPASDAPLKLTCGWNGELYFIIDHRTRRIYESIDPGVLGSGGRALALLGMIEFVREHPFDDELEASTLELLGERTIGGEPCHEVRVVYSGGRGESTWLFSKSDHLPRGRIRKYVDGQGRTGELRISISELEVDPRIDPAIFQMRQLEGYERVDGFHP